MFSSNQHAWPLYLTIGNIQKDIRCTYQKRTSIVVGLIACPWHGATAIEEACHSVVGTVLSQLSHLDLTGPVLN
jgi:hypothetical protein